MSRKIRYLLVVMSAVYACAPGSKEPLADAAADSDAALPSQTEADAAAARALDAGDGRDAPAAASQDASVAALDAAAALPAHDAAPQADAAVAATDGADSAPADLMDAMWPTSDAQADPPAADASVPSDASTWVFRPDAALRDAKARRTIMPDIPEAENMFFTADGRLFVSGGESVFEIKRDAAGTWTKTDLFHEDCLVEGITHANGYIYGVCSLTQLDKFAEAYLLGGALTAEPRMQIIGRLDDFGVPNGMDADPQGNLYTTYSGLGTIAKLVLSKPLELARVEVWSKEELPVVNGLRFIGDFVYFTSMDLGSLGTRFGRIRIQPDGSAGRAEFLLSRGLTLFDDLGSIEGGIMLTDFVTGSVLFYRDGKVLAETPALTFYGPSSVLQGKPPLFRQNQLLVTEKGLFGVRNETDGDRLSVYDL